MIASRSRLSQDGDTPLQVAEKQDQHAVYEVLKMYGGAKRPELGATDHATPPTDPAAATGANTNSVHVAVDAMGGLDEF